MGKNKLEKRKDAKSGKVVMMPQKHGGKDVEESEEGKKKTSADKALRSAAEELVIKDCGALALKLMEKAKDGDVESTEMLVTLIEKRKKNGGEGDGGDEPCLAEQLMAGPTWEEVLEARRKAEEEEEAEAASNF